VIKASDQQSRHCLQPAGRPVREQTPDRKRVYDARYHLHKGIRNIFEREKIDALRLLDQIIKIGRGDIV